MLDFKQGLSVFKIDSFILGLIIKSNSICYLALIGKIFE